MKTAITYDWFTGQDYKERILEVFARQFFSSDLFLLAYEDDSYLSSLGFNRIYNGKLKTREIWKNIEKFPKVLSKMNLRGYSVVTSLSCGPMHWIKKNKYSDNDLVYQIGYCFGPYPYLWDDGDADTLRSFWNRCSSNDRLEFRKLDQEYFAGIDLLLVPDNHAAEKMKEVHNRTPVILHPPVSEHIFHPRSGDKDYFIINSDIEHFRGLKPVIETFNYLNDKLIILGEGTRHDEFRELARPNISFLGYCDESERAFYLRNAIAAIVPDIRHYNHFAKEALSMGVPVLAHRHSSAAELIHSEENGVLFAEHTPDSILGAVLYALENQFDRKKIIKSAEKFNRLAFEEAFKKLIVKHLPPVLQSITKKK